MNIYKEVNRYIGKKKKKQTQKPKKQKPHKRNQQCSLDFLSHSSRFDFHLFFTAWDHLKVITALVTAGLIICLKHLVAVDALMDFYW